MGLPVYVVNFDELEITVKDANVTVDTTEVEDILSTYFPKILDLIDKLAGWRIKGVQKIKGFSTLGDEITFTPEKDIVITGVTFSQNIFDRNCLDSWAVKLRNGSGELLLDTVYSKDTLQHKYFENYYPVPTGHEIVITPTNYDGANKTYWFDLEYVEINE